MTGRAVQPQVDCFIDWWVLGCHCNVIQGRGRCGVDSSVRAIRDEDAGHEKKAKRPKGRHHSGPRHVASDFQASSGHVFTSPSSVIIVMSACMSAHECL